jgi:hypothetical protein
MKYKEIYGDVSELDMRLETDFLKGEQSNLGQMGGFKKGQIEIETDNINNVSQSVDILEKTPVKKSPALQKISEITKLRDGTLGSRTPMDKDGLPKNLIRDKDGKPLILYYGDMGQVYDPVTQTYKPTPSGIPGKLTNKFLPSGRTYTTDKKIGNFVTPNPIFASGYATQEGGSVIPVYIIADKVTNIKASSFMDIDKAGGDAKRGEVFVGDVGFDAAPPVKVVDGKEVKDLELRDESIKKYGTKQYTFNKGTQVFSAITGERLTELPTIKQNIKNKLLNLSKKEEDIMLKNLSPEDRLKYKNIKTGGDETDDLDEEFINDLFYMFRDMDLKKNLEKRNLAKGGDMKKQMDLFQEGGLKDEGGTVDPVSGNDVPPGSTQEEVRDDIPAQLSEGEFVFPADVVRYIGLEKLMTLRQEAKAGLKRMEEMGQMGNSDEATLPDDIPFTIDDLDMEDELEYNEGGVVKAQTGTFVAPGSGVTTMPSQFAGQQLPSAGATPSYVAPVIPPPAPAPIGGFRPLTTSAQTGQQVTGTTPSFQTLIGTKPGQYDEFREYVNEAGMKLQIPFKDGQPIYPIPEGYTFVDPEEVKTEEVTTKEVTPQTTRVVEQDGGDDPDPTTTSAVDLTGAPLSYQSMFDMDKLDTALKDIAFGQLSLFDPKGAISRGVMGQVDINNVNLSYQKDLLTNFKSNLTGKYGKDFNLAVMDTFDRDRLANSMVELSQVTQNVLTDSNNKELNIDDLVSKANRMGMSVNKKDLNVKNTNILSKNKITQLAKNMITKELQQREASAKARRDFEVAADKATDKETIDTLSQAQKDVISAAKDMGISYGVPDISDTDSGTSDEGSPGMGGGDSGDTSGYTDDTGLGVGAKGGFFSKSKMTKQKPKVKKMKRGGLASRK